MREYYPHIDGLRALAVLSVIAFHAFPAALPGGFLGVDIFFVISGFLITSIIVGDTLNGRFSLTSFFANRIRRIFPALILVSVFCLAFGFASLFVKEYAQLGHHIAATSVFVINFILESEIRYFSNQAELVPMLHLWSLAIEEQFYLFWPMFLLLVIHLGGRIQFWTASLLVGAWAISFYLAAVDFSLNFYHPMGRFWELLFGATLAIMATPQMASINERQKSDAGKVDNIGPIRNTSRLARLRSDLLCGFGLSLILLSLYLPSSLAGLAWYRASSASYLLLPIIGAGAIILSGHSALINRLLLSNRLAVAIGKISYPLYLWHWPLFSFHTILSGNDEGHTSKILLIFLAFLLATLTYLIIEKPIRNRKSCLRTPAILVCTLLLVGGLAFSVSLSNGFIARYELLARDAVETEKLIKISEGWDFTGYPSPKSMIIDRSTGLKRIGANEDEKVLFIGDSHMEQYMNSFDALATEKGQAQKSVLFRSTQFPPDFQEIRPYLDDTVDAVALSFFWAWRYGNASVNQKVRCCGGHNQSANKITIPAKSPDEMDQIDDRIVEFVRRVKEMGKDVWIVLDNPFGEELSARLMLQRNGLRIHLDVELGVEKEVAIERQQPVRGRLISLAKGSNAHVIDPLNHLCNQVFCPAFSDNDDLLYKDYDHLSLFSSKTLGRYVLSITQD